MQDEVMRDWWEDTKQGNPEIGHEPSLEVACVGLLLMN